MKAQRIKRRTFLARVAGGVAGVYLMREARTEGAASGPLEFAFGVMTDIQYCDCEPSGTRYFRNSLAKAEACVQDFNSKTLAHVLQLGDFIDHDLVSFDQVLPIYGKLTAPRYHVLGNHDFSVKAEEKDSVPAKLGMGRRYYEFTHLGWRFIVLDGNDVSVYARPAGSAQHREAQAIYDRLKEAGAANAQTWNGAVGQEQLDWLRATLEDAAKLGQKALVFCHFPVYPANAHNLWNDAQVIEVLEASGCVAAYINGHNHAGNYAQKKGIHYLTVHGMVETPDTTAYAVIGVYKDHLAVHGSGREPKRTLEIA